MSEKKAYTQALKTGKYDRNTGLSGKYDNVRRCWEDRVTAHYLAPPLRRLVAERKRRNRGLRILDMGCGSGDGLELITGISDGEAGLSKNRASALGNGMLEAYLGLDINPDLLKQAEEVHAPDPRVGFVRGDLSNGLDSGLLAEHQAFDLYFSSYGTYSHLTGEMAARLMADAAEHAAPGALLVADWLGRYSYEWQDLWQKPGRDEYFMDYRISYIYPEEERHREDIASFPLRLVARQEVEEAAKQAAKLSRAEFKPVAVFDRSLLVGRHMDTAEYNPNAPALRTAVNSLFEKSVRTDLSRLLVKPVPKPGFESQNRFFDRLFNCGNRLVEYVASLLENHDRGKDLPEVPEDPSGPLRTAMSAMRSLVRGAGWITWCDPRAEIIEPQLGYCLRNLEMELQPGAGLGHGLVAVFEIRK